MIFIDLFLNPLVYALAQGCKLDLAVYYADEHNALLLKILLLDILLTLICLEDDKIGRFEHIVIGHDRLLDKHKGFLYAGA